MEGFTPLLLLAAIVVVFWLLIMRPQRNQQRQIAAVQASLVPGQRVMTRAGLYATVSVVDDGDVVLEVAPGVNCRYRKEAIVQVVDSQGTAQEQEGSSGSSDPST